MRLKLRALLVIGGAIAGVMLLALPAFAGSFTSPTGTTASPYNVPGNATGDPQSFTITLSGYAPGSTVYVEQCDGIDPSAPGWSATDDCESGSSPSGRIVAADGTATFPANDPNFGFTPFKGESQQSKFNCLSPNDPSPNNGLADFRNCSVRASTNNVATTADQTFLPIRLPDAQTPPPNTPEAPYAVLLPLGFIGVAGAFMIVRKRRSAGLAA